MHFMTRIRVLLLGFTLIISLLTCFAFLRVDQTGLSCSYYYEEEAKGPPVYTGLPRAVDVGLVKPLELEPSSRFSFTFCFEGFFNLPEQGGRYGLYVVSNIPIKMNIGGQPFQFPSLKTQTKTKEWRVTAFPLGTPHQAIDDIQETRWDTGRPKQRGDWFALDLGKDEKVLGLVLDNVGSSDHDSSTDFKVDAALIRAAYREVSRFRIPKKRAQAVDAWFKPFRARYLRITQREIDTVYYWSIHELFMITESSLDRGAVRVNLSQTEPLKIEGSLIPQPSGLWNNYLLVHFFWKPPGKNWERVPQWALRPDSLKGLGRWGAQGVNVLTVVLPWIWAVLAAFWVAVLIPVRASLQEKKVR
jgi:hypothetical protein